jgi:hypothetical protein
MKPLEAKYLKKELSKTIVATLNLFNLIFKNMLGVKERCKHF